MREGGLLCSTISSSHIGHTSFGAVAEEAGPAREERPIEMLDVRSSGSRSGVGLVFDPGGDGDGLRGLVEEVVSDGAP